MPWGRNFFREHRTALTAVVVIIAAAFFARVLVRGWATVRPLLHSPEVPWLLLGIVVLSGFTMFRVFGWQYTLRRLGNRVAWKPAGESLVLAEAVRYVPGNIWSVLSRMSLATRLGIPADQGLLATVLEVLALLVSSIIVAGAFAVGTSALPLWLRGLSGIGVLAVAGVAALVPKAGTFVNALLRLVRRPAVSWQVRSSTFWGLAAWCAVAWVCFSFGSYALVRSLVALPANATLPILAAMPFSWFIGYVSFLTPSGLGVREVALAALVAPSVGAASVIVATVSRIGMLLTELGWIVFFGAKWVWRGILALWQRVRSPQGVAVLLALVFSVYFSVVTVSMHSKVITTRFDLGNMDQVVWNTSQGRIFQSTDPYGTTTVSRLAYHADFFLILLAPVYWLIASPVILLILQACIVGLGGWYAFRLAKHFTGRPWLAVGLGFAYLLAPTLQRAVLFDFHSLTVGATFALAMVLAALEHRWKAFTAWAVLLALCKEELGLVVASLAALQWFRDPAYRRRWLAIMLVALAYVAVVFFGLMPAARHGETSFYAAQYADVGNSPSSILKTALQNPLGIASRIFGNVARHLYAALLAPFAFLSILGLPWLLLAWPDFVVNLFNDRIQTKLIIYHYQAVIEAFAFVAACAGIALLTKRFSALWDVKVKRFLHISLPTFLTILVLTCAFVESFRFSPMPYSLQADNRVFWRAPLAPVIHETFATIPQAASVSATNTLGAQLAERQELFAFPLGIGQADYVVALDAPAQSDEWKVTHPAIIALQTDTRYQLVTSVQNFTVYKKR